jgi:predicted dehydrogenase
MDRRHFTLSSVAALAAPYIRAQSTGKVYRTALIGSGWWGMNLLREGLASNQIKCVALADPDQRARESAADDIEGLAGNKPAVFNDYREMLEKEKPEVVIIATPDHWHALTSIAAMKAGAHVLVEKPTAHTVGESKAMVRVAKETGSIVQVGLHRRLGPHHVEAHRFLKDGKVGQVGMVRCFVHSGGSGKPEAPGKNTEPPKGLDWDLWLGPAPARPFTSRLHPGAWRSWLDFGNGQLGDWGVHWLDQVLMWTEEKYPRSIYSTGGREIAGPAILNDKEQTSDAPDSQIAVFDFEGFTATWENRKFADNNAEKHKIGTYFYGTKGTLHIGWRDGWTFYPANGKDPVIHGEPQLQEPDGHNLTLLWADFLKALDNKTQPTCDIESAHRSSVLPMLGMASLKLGRSIQWDGITETTPGDAEATKLLTRAYRPAWEYPV